jgi:hypothetical protein
LRKADALRPVDTRWRSPSLVRFITCADSARLSDQTRADPPDGYGGVDGNPLAEAPQSAGRLGLVEQRKDFAESGVIQIVGPPVLIEEVGYMGLHHLIPERAEGDS